MGKAIVSLIHQKFEISDMQHYILNKKYNKIRIFILNILIHKIIINHRWIKT